MASVRSSERHVPLRAQLYTYQLCRSLAYIHSLGVCHRDIKPQNLLVHPETHLLKLCDFGSAKILVKGEPNVSYICSRYYRAPELIFGATDYTCCIDVWSVGCVLAELLLGVPLFPGESGVDQLVEIIKVCRARAQERMGGRGRGRLVRLGSAMRAAGARARCAQRRHPSTRFADVLAVPCAAGARHTHPGGDPGDEPKLYRVQVPSGARPPAPEAAAASPSVRKPRPSHLPPLPRSSRRSSRTRGTRSSAPARRRTPSSWSRASCAIRPTRASSPSRLARCPSSTSCATKACSCRATAPLRLCSTLSRKVRSHAPRFRVCAAARGAARTALTACSHARRRAFRASAQHQKQANARMVQGATAMSRCARAVNRQLRACLFIAAS